MRIELRAVRHAINELRSAIDKHSEAIHASKEGDRNKPSATQSVRAVVAFDDKTVGDTKTENDRHYSVQNSIRRATWLAFIAAAIYAFFAAWQVCEMRIATAQVTRQINDFEAAQRAVLAPEATWDKDKGEIVWTLKNVGHSAALDMVAQFSGGSGTAHRPAIARGQPFIPPVEALRSIQPLCSGSSGTIIPDGKDWSWTDTDVTIDPDAVKGNGYFFRYVNFAYKDIFGKKHYDYLCLVNNFNGGYIRHNLSDFDRSKCQ